MRFRVLACDYDGTIATDGVVAPATLTALEVARASGRRLLLVTGRIGTQLEAAFPIWGLFDRLVLENGAVLVDPSLGVERLLCEPVSDDLVAELHRRGVEPLVVGRCACAAGIRHRDAIQAAIRDLDLRLDTGINRGSLVVLPPGISKASGALAALRALGETAAACVAVGDAENDLPMLAIAGCGVAVADALDQTKAAADLVTSRPNAAGVVELIHHLVADDLEQVLAGVGGRRAARL